MATTILSLPNELTRRIFSLAAEDLRNDPGRGRILNMLDIFSRVSRLWHAIATPMLYEDIETTHNNSLILLVETFLLHEPGYTKLVKRFHHHSPDRDGTRCGPPSLICKRFLGCNFPALKKLELEEGFATWFDLLPSLPAMPVLKSLHIEGNSLPMLNGTTFAVLEELSLTHFNAAPEEEETARAYPSFPALTHLIIDNVVGNYEVNQWLRTAISGSSLKKLSVRFWGLDPNGDEQVEAWPGLVGSLPYSCIEDIDMQVDTARVYCEFPDSFYEPLEPFDNLRKLRVTGSNSSFGSLVNLPQSLESLKVSFRRIQFDEISALLEELKAPDAFPHLATMPDIRIIQASPLEVYPTAGEEFKKVCQKAYAHFRKRGLADTSSARDFSIWNSASHIFEDSRLGGCFFEDYEWPEGDEVESPYAGRDRGWMKRM